MNKNKLVIDFVPNESACVFVYQVGVAAVLRQRRQPEGAHVLLFVDDGHGAHQRAQDQLHVVLEVVDLVPTQQQTNRKRANKQTDVFLQGKRQ